MSNITGQNRIKYQIDNLGAVNDRSNAPVTRVLWQCNNLPDGLTLSEDGELSGRPIATGTYACAVTVTTNWGSATKIINIRVTD